MPNSPTISETPRSQSSHNLLNKLLQQPWHFPAHVHQKANLAVYVSLTVVGIFAFVFACLTLTWPLVNDGPLMHYIGWLIHQGAVPYRDIFDMNFPGTYLMHWLILCVPGNIDLNWRIFDLTLLASTLLFMVKLLPPKAYWSASAVCIAFTLFYIGLGNRFAGERDMVMLPLEMGGALCLLHFIEDKRLCFWRVFVAGTLFGAAATIKPFGLTMLILEMGLVASILFLREHSWKTIAMVWCIAIAGFMVPVGSVLLWLYAIGGLTEFVDILWNYIIPIYSQCNAQNRHGFRCLGLLENYHLPLFLTTALILTAYMAYSRRHETRFAIVVVAFLAGLAQYAFQGKGLLYHMIPAVGFGLLLCFWIFHEALQQRNIGRWCRMCLPGRLHHFAPIHQNGILCERNGHQG